MPRRQFVADLHKARSEPLPLGCHDLQPADDDGQFEFLFATPLPSGSSPTVKVTALIPDLAEYPQSHEYMIFSGDEAPPHIADALQNIRKTNGKTVSELLELVSATLTKLSPDRDGDTEMADSQNDDELLEEDDDDYDVYDSDHEAFQTEHTRTNHLAESTPGARTTVTDKAFRDRIRSDIKFAKQAGFKVGVLGHVLDGFNAFVTVSIRMSKLGISAEAMQAWQMSSSDYLILILQYPNGYKTSEELQGFDSIRLDPNIGMRVCAGKKYKPTLEDAIKAFTVVKKDDGLSIGDNQLPNAEQEDRDSSIKDTFISRPLNGLLKERFVAILRYRGLGLGWNGAEDLYKSMSSAGAQKTDAIEDHYFVPEMINHALPNIVNADHFTSRGSQPGSFPLLAMQFMLRHFVRCTEFCLVCHRSMNTELEAIKPYVCDDELCLYQYMTLGFGPSIEHEILAQPYVVDLLVSFCYNSAWSRRLKEFPDGLSLVVPPANSAAINAHNPYTYYHGRHPAPVEETKIERTPASVYEVGFDHDRNQIIFFDVPEKCPVRRGDWIVMKTKGVFEDSEIHCRVSDITYFPTVSINDAVTLRLSGRDDNEDLETAGTAGKDRATAKPVSPATTPKWVPASFQIYCEDFKSLTTNEKCLSICRLLDTLPNVKALQEYVSKRSSADLKNWVERISPSALSLLRWIIASNRACIMQVDGEHDGQVTHHQEERLFGMNNYMQFRFAMGAPDKEQRFINEVRNTTARLSLQYPTLFAWHGSPLHNWHMIIREGLHCKNIDHGRAYGDGVYHALDASTSSGYSGMALHQTTGQGRLQGQWPSSLLRVSSALALNEIVNAPAEFTSQSPYYVVKQLDWIQTRYLFVQCAPVVESIKIGEDTKPKNALQQDPKRVPRGTTGPIVIPASAINSRRSNKDERRPGTPNNPPAQKKAKARGGVSNPILIEDDDDANSVATDISDLNILIEDDPEPEPVTPAVVKAPRIAIGPDTDFIPGALEFSMLPLMPLPTYATSGTTRRLMRELQTIDKVQRTTPLADLGWFIDVEKIENVYQWIVELHSFHTFEFKGKKLPLAQDMKQKGISSIVLEIRFNKDFPYTPPYVRVVRPRFLSLMQGGGGHIVMGGAMCMELLTNTGWSSVSSMESVLMQIRMAIASEPFARLDKNGHGDYGTHEAADGYLRACERHGWQVPPGFKEMAYESGEAASSFV